MIALDKFCFVSEANYPRYAERMKVSALKNYLDLKLDEVGVPFYISTNCPEMFAEYSGNNMIRICDIEELRKHDNDSKQYEPLPNPPPQNLYPSQYPWNLRRFIVRKAVSDGYLGIWHIDADCKFNHGISRDSLVHEMISAYEPNTIKSNAARFVYKGADHGGELWNLHDLYMTELNLTIPPEQLDTVDGWCQFWMGRDTDSLLQMLDNWDKLAIRGFTNPQGYKTIFMANLSLVIPMSGFTLISHPFPLQPHHHFEDRY